MSTSATPSTSRRTRVALTVSAVVIAVLVIAFFVIANLYTDVLWFDQLGFLNVLTTQWVAGGVMFLIGFVAMAVPVWASIEIAFRSRPVYAKLNAQLDRYQQVIEPLRRVAMFGIPGVLGLFAGVSASTSWPVVLQWLNKTPFGEVDPQFGFDISFFVYDLPLYHGVVGFASAVVLLAAIAMLATSYLYGAIRFSGREVRISRSARVQISVTAARLPRAAGGEPVAGPVHGALLAEPGLPGDRRRLHRGQRDHPGPCDPRRHRGARRRAVHRHGDRRALAAADHRHRAAARERSGHRQHLPVDRAALPGGAERAHPRVRLHRTQHHGHPGRLRHRRCRGDPLQRDDGCSARRPAGGRGDHREHPHHRPGPRHPHVPAVRAGAPVLPVPRVPRRGPLRHRRKHPGHRHRAARAQPGRPELAGLGQRHRHLHARLRRRRRVRQPARERRQSGVPRVGHPRYRRARGLGRRVRAARLLRRELAGVLDRRGAGGQRAGRARLPGRRRRGHERQPHDDVRRRRRAEARQRLQAPHLRGQVPVGADLPLGVRQRRVADPLRPQSEGPHRQGRPVPHPRQRSVPGDRRRPHPVDRRRLHDDGELPVLERAVAVHGDRGHLPAAAAGRPSTTSTTSATRSRPPSTRTAAR